jgi:hypothetical protein
LASGAPAPQVFNGTTWAATSPQTLAATGFVSCTSSTFCEIAGQPPAVDALPATAAASYDGSAWSASMVIPFTSTPSAVSCGAGELCATTSFGNLAVHTTDGWTDGVGLDSDNFLNAVSCAPVGSFCMALDTAGNVIIGS